MTAKPAPQPLTDDEIRDRYRRGDSFAQVANAAYQRNRLGRQQVREIVFGAQRQ